MTTQTLENNTEQTATENPTYRFYKAITPEVTVNTKNRFDKNKIKWIEDITYKNTGNKAYFLQIPYEQTSKPAGCKKMFFIQYYPGPDNEFVGDAEASMFYTTIYPRYEHVAEVIINNQKSLIPWHKLEESAKQNFVKIWGTVILSNIYTMHNWKINSDSPRMSQLQKRPEEVNKTVEEENIQQFLTTNSTSERVDLKINCDKKDIQTIINTLAFESATIYTIQP